MPQSTDDKKGTTPPKTPAPPATKTWYGFIRGWWRGKPRVQACIDVIKQRHVRVNLHVKIYERAKWPHCKPEYLLEQLTINIPASMIKDINNEITEHYGVRVKKTKKHTWKKTRYTR